MLRETYRRVGDRRNRVGVVRSWGGRIVLLFELRFARAQLQIGSPSRAKVRYFSLAAKRRHADTFPLRADAKFLQTAVKGAAAEPEVFGSEERISIMPGKRTVDQE